MWQSFYSNGKLLITGEYAVLDGALALAIPTKFGQQLRIRLNETGLLKWTGIDESDNIWFEQRYHLDNLKSVEDQVVDPSKEQTSNRLVSILLTAKELNPQFLKGTKGVEVETKTDFNRNWGLGTSSTLINNIAQWAEVDAFQLNRSTFGGSGYDIACAQSNGPLLYRLQDGKAEVEKVNFHPSFAGDLYFVFLNQKMNSREAIDNYRKASFDKDRLLDAISGLTHEFLNCKQLDHFVTLVQKHESLISKALGVPTVKQSFFADYPGAIKSLGAWGGDFVLAASVQQGPKYFKNLGFETVIPFEEMIL